MTKAKSDSLFEFAEEKEIPCARTVSVAFDSGADAEFDYSLPDEFPPISPGQRVTVPFGRANHKQTAFCVAVKDSADHPQTPRRFRLKKVSKIIDEKPLVDAELLDLARWISSYYVCPLGQVLSAMIPAAVKKGIGVKKQKLLYLAKDFEKKTETLRGKKQKLIVEFLKSQKACTSESAVKVETVLENAESTNAPLKKLTDLGLIKTTSRTFIKDLPIIPEGLRSKAEHVTLNTDQEKALTEITERINSDKFAVTVLHGVTDSGKTEVYIRAIEKVLAKNKTAIIMLPEIALTAQTVQRFSSRFKKIALMHSKMTASQRNGQWQKIKKGDADVVIGARSAIFAPLKDLGLIIVDEEHEPSYKQDTVPRYHGRDTAIKRTQLANAHCILGSATPSLETLLNCQNKKHFHLSLLPNRVMNLPRPEMRLVNLKQSITTQDGQKLISPPLIARLQEILIKKEQAILLLNRRGYSNFIFCPSCGHSMRCQNCDVTLTFHRKNQSYASAAYMHAGQAVCHYCMAKTLVPRKCPLCKKSFTMIGLGAQRLEEELIQNFPNAKVARIDSDSMASGNYYKLLKDFSKGKIDILAGTQMLAKGLHFPNVTVVGIISADTSLYLPDFRANERTFQLITQVAGRAGRSEKKGVVFVQTFLPEQPAIKFAIENNHKGFIAEELKHRQSCNLPPYWRLAVIGLRDKSFEKLEAASNAMKQQIDTLIQKFALKINVRGPMPPAISRLHRFHRMQIILQAPEASIFMEFFKLLRTSKPIRPAVKITIDIDPINLL